MIIRDGSHKNKLLILFIIFFSIPAYSGNMTPQNEPAFKFYNSGGWGTTLGKVYTPTSQAIDIRNIMGSTWDLDIGNAMPEKYILKKPYPYSYKYYQAAKRNAEKQGAGSLVGNGFEPSGHVWIEKTTLGYKHPKSMVNIYGDKLINFYTTVVVTQKVSKRIVVEEKILVTASVIKNVLDHSINMKGVKVANIAVMQSGRLLLMASSDLKYKSTKKVLKQKIVKILKKVQEVQVAVKKQATIRYPLFLAFGKLIDTTKKHTPAQPSNTYAIPSRSLANYGGYSKRSSRLVLM